MLVAKLKRPIKWVRAPVFFNVEHQSWDAVAEAPLSDGGTLALRASASERSTATALREKSIREVERKDRAPERALEEDD